MADGEGNWRDQRVVILGLARQGMALARYLSEQGAHVVVSDLKPAEELEQEREALRDLSLEYVLGGHPASLLDEADLLCLSAGVPLEVPLAQEARRRGIRVANDAQLFLDACPARVAGITGSAGKTTTTALVAAMARGHFQGTLSRVWVGGNIGNALIQDLPRMRPSDVVVMELSSFQLELMTASPQVAAVLNVTPNHLDRHRSMETYVTAKAHILDYQSSGDIAILGRDDPGAWALRSRAKGRIFSFGLHKPERGKGTFARGGKIWLGDDGGETSLCSLDAIRLRGEHNVLNVLAACAIASAMDVSPQAIEAGVRGFQGLPHRLEYVRSVGGADWYNDSIATAPERALAAMRSFEEPIVLLAGGRDKDLPWGEFLQFVRQRVDHLILFGEAGGKIFGLLEERPAQGRLTSVEVCPSLEAAVQAAAKVVQAGDVVLLAPGGTSFDEFRDFEQRGEKFKELVWNL